MKALRDILTNNLMRLLLFTSILLIATGLAFIYGWKGQDASESAKMTATPNLPSLHLIPSRGTIYDCNMRSLAVSVKSPSIYLYPANVPNERKEDVILALMNFLDINREKATCYVNGQKERFVPILKQTTEAKWNSFYARQLPGVFAVIDAKREYPQVNLFDSIIGRTDSELNGISGLETQYNSHLAGKPGQVSFTKGAFFNLIKPKLKTIIEPIAGHYIVLSIDSVISHFCREILKEMSLNTYLISASVILANPQDGEILGLYEYQKYTAKSNIAKSSSQSPLFMPFEPGEMIHAILVGAALNGSLTQNTELVTEKGKLTLKETLVHANQSGIEHLSRLIGGKGVYRAMETFGLLSATGLDFPDEKHSTMLPPESWNRQKFRAITAGRQVAFTPFQVLRATCAVANGGKMLHPTLTKYLVGKHNQATLARKTHLKQRIFGKQTAQTLTEMMVEATRHGVSQAAGVTGYDVAAVSGAVIDSDGVYCCTGFAPAGNPRVVLTVVLELETPYEGGKNPAATAFSQILGRTLHYIKVPVDDTSVFLSRLSKP